MSEDGPDPLQALAQLIVAMSGAATAIRSYYVGLIDEGFTEEQAMTLAVAFQTSLLETSMRP